MSDILQNHPNNQSLQGYQSYSSHQGPHQGHHQQIIKQVNLQSTPVNHTETQVITGQVIQRTGTVVQQMQPSQIVYLTQPQVQQVSQMQLVPVQVQQVQPTVVQKVVPQIIYQAPPELQSELERLQIIINDQYSEITSLKSKILSYEQHILTHRGLEEKSSFYIIEIDRLSKIISEKLLVINELQVQLFNKDKLLNDVEIDRDHKENEKRSKQRDNQNLAQDNLRLNQLLQERDREIYSLKIKLQDISIVDEYKIKLENYIKEINNLHIVINDKQNEYSSLNEKYHQLSVTFDIQRSQWEQRSVQLNSEVELLRSQINRRSSEYDDQARQISILTQQITDIKIYESRYNELNNSYTWLSQENQRLKERVEEYEFQVSQIEHVKKSGKKQEQDNQNLLIALKQQDEEIQRLKSQIVNLNATVGQSSIFESRISEQNIRINVLVQENDRIRADFSSIISQNEQYRSQLINLENVNADLNNQLKVRISENQRQIEMYQIKIREVESLQVQLSKSDARITQVTIFESKIADQQRTIQSITEELNHYRSIVIDRQKQIDGLLIKVADFENRNTEIRVYESRYFEIQKSYSVLVQDMEVLKKRYEQSQEEIQSIMYQKESEKKSGNNKQYQFQQQIESLQSQLILKQQEIDSLNQRNLSVEVSIKNSYMSEIKQWESRYNESQLRIASLIKEVDNLNLVLKDSKINNEQVNRYQLQISQLQSVLSRQETEINQLTVFKVSSSDYQSKILLLTSEIERLNKQISSLLQQIDSQKIRYSSFELNIKSYEEKHYVLNAEIDRLNEQLRMQESDLRVWRTKYGEYSLLYKSHQEHLSIMVLMFAEIENLRNRLDRKEVEVEDARRVSLSFYKR